MKMTPDQIERIVTVWRAVLGLPTDFPINDLQLSICMSMCFMIEEQKNIETDKDKLESKDKNAKD